MDDAALNPPEFNLVRGVYSELYTQGHRRFTAHLGLLPSRVFHYLDFRLLNVGRDLRKYIAANVKEVGATSLQYAHTKFRLTASNYATNLNTQLDVFHEQRQFQRHQIKSLRLKQCLLMLMAKQTLPTDTKRLRKLYDHFTELY